MIINCSECQAPISESNKNRPPNLAPNIKWFLCRECDRGIEIIGDVIQPENSGEVSHLEYTETVTMTQYVTIKKTKKGVTKYKYSDPERTKLIGEETIA